MATLLLSGCGAMADADGDGASWAVDCDDEDPDRAPGILERCDGIDNDCDGTVDEDPSDGTDYWLDADGDGFGSGAPTTACEAAEGRVTRGEDCDDTDPAVHPDAVEICNQRDDDCDGRRDQADPDLDTSTLVDRFEDHDGDGWGTGASRGQACAVKPGEAPRDGDCDDADPRVHPETRWWVDADLDGWGEDGTEVVQCEQPAGTALRGGDCEDGIPAVNPGAPEGCNGVDDDCDGLLDGADTLDPSVSPLWFPDDDEDGFGDIARAQPSCEPVPGRIDRGGDCDDTDPDVNPDAVEICSDGIDQTCDGHANTCGLGGRQMAGDAGVIWDPPEDGWPSGAALLAGDLDGDGQAEVMAGEADRYLLVAWSDRALLDGPMPARSYRLDGLPTSWSRADGLVGDGRADFIYAARPGGAFIGPPLHVIPGQLRPEPDQNMVEEELEEARISTFRFREGVFDTLAPTPDLDGDGFDDVFAGNTEVLSGSGAVQVLWGAGDRFSLRVSGTAWLLGSPGRALGTAMATADLDGDGSVEVAVGAPGATSGPGAVYLMPAPTTRFEAPISVGEATAVVHGDGNDALGTTLGVADLNGDGYDDLAVGAPGHGPDDEGRIWILEGSAAGLPSEADASSIAWWWLTGDRAAARLGAEGLLDPGDVDSDGLDDLVILDPGAAVDGLDGAGRVLVFRGGPVRQGSVALDTADAGVWGTTENGGLGTAAAFGDIDGDGFTDMALTEPGPTLSDPTRILLFFGGLP